MLMAILGPNLKNTGMPSRHISSQSFDEILSELGDDPAIPDPHGIRKTASPKRPPLEPPKLSKERAQLEAFSNSNLLNQLQKWGGIFVFGACLIIISIALFMAYGSLKTSSEALVQESQKEISELKKELAILRTELQSEQDDLYEVIDSMEVSIHFLTKNIPTKPVLAKPQANPHEAELRRWRYLGASEMGGSRQAFFHTGKSNVIFQKGMLVLGDWRLTQLQKDLATLTDNQGKTLLIKPSKTE
jgi:hypothetical protein